VFGDIFMKKGALTTNITPLPLAPIVATKDWGTVCHTSFNVPSKAEGLCWGEIWLASEDFGLVNKVASGPCSGFSLTSVKAHWGEVLTGQKDLKEAKNKNSLNVSFRIERTGDKPGPVRVLSGDEFWYVLEAGADSWRGADTSSEEGTWTQRLKKTTLEPGDRFLIPQGLVHCQGPSATILKVLPSHSMVQTIYDWERPPDPWDFIQPTKPLPIVHTDLPYLHTICSGRDRILYQGSQYTATLVNTNFFSATGEKMSLICPVKGRGSIETSGVKETVRLHPGQSVIIPAGIGRYSIKSSTIISYLLFEFSND
jgi:mannose-6-phosphate isomerase-like protein (cupin superfamily)